MTHKIFGVIGILGGIMLSGFGCPLQSKDKAVVQKAFADIASLSSYHIEMAMYQNGSFDEAGGISALGDPDQTTAIVFYNVDVVKPTPDSENTHGIFDLDVTSDQSVMRMRGETISLGKKNYFRLNRIESDQPQLQNMSLYGESMLNTWIFMDDTMNDLPLDTGQSDLVADLTSVFSEISRQDSIFANLESMGSATIDSVVYDTYKIPVTDIPIEGNEIIDLIDSDMIVYLDPATQMLERIMIDNAQGTSGRNQQIDIIFSKKGQLLTISEPTEYTTIQELYQEMMQGLFQGAAVNEALTPEDLQNYQLDPAAQAQFDAAVEQLQNANQ